MKRISLTIIFAVLTACSLFAQESSILWKVSGKDLKTESYLLGTIHMMCEEDFKMSEKVKSAAQNVDQIIFEIDLNEPEKAAKAQELAMTPTADFFKDFDVKKLSFIDSALTANQLSIQMFDMLSPTTVISLLTLKSFECPDLTKIKSVELELKKLAPNTKTTDLETIEFQMNLLGNLATPEYFYEYFKNYDEYIPLTKKMVEYYNSENLEGLNSLFVNSKYMSKEQFDAMLTKRNINWVEILPSKIKDTKSLIAVGAGHLVGDTGLIKLLRDKGYTVTPVK